MTPLEKLAQLQLRTIFALLPIERTKPSRLRDRQCAYDGCTELILRASTYCRHHLGVLHGGASARTYSCSTACQGKHVRCKRCRCLTGGDHIRRLRDGLCYLPGTPSCWSDLHGHQDEDLALWIVTCGLCGYASQWLGAPPPPRTQCENCASQLLLAERQRAGLANGLRA